MTETELHERRYAIKGKDRNGSDTIMYASTEVLPDTIHLSTQSGNHFFLPFKDFNEVMAEIKRFKGVE